MRVSLQSDSGKILSLKGDEWRTILKVARRNGWEPMGTELNIDYLNERARDPDGGLDRGVLKEMMESWKGSYLTQERQYVTYADALNIAFALEEAVKAKSIDMGSIGAFIDFCKQGRFTIS
jgi:hypothetical protein